MITDQPKATTTAPVEDPVLQEQLAKIEALKAELATLKQESTDKQAAISNIEKECGITTWVKFQEKVKPVTVALSNAAAKARPVVKQATEKISETASTLMKRASKSEEGNAAIDETPAATVVSDEPVEPKAEPPAATAEKKDDADDSAEATEDGEDTKKTEAEMQESLAQIAEIRKALSELNIQIKNKESEIAWLEKKAGLNTGPFGKFGTAMEPHLASVKQGLSDAKVKTGAKLGVAKKETRRLWSKALVSATKMKSSVMSKYSKDGEKAKKSSGAPVESEEDMYKRYA